MQVRSLLAAAVFLAAAVAGCAESGSPAQDADAPCAGVGASCMDDVTAPHVDARKTLDDLKEFSEAHPYRSTGSPTMEAARDDLVSRLEGTGLSVHRHAFSGGGQNILAFKWGSDRDHWIVVGAHYDVTEGAVYGTYDDGSGTAMVFELAAAFADVPTERTIVFAEFDQEEMGLVGSSAFIEDLADGKFPYNGTVDGMVDLDMVGITWPHPASLIVWENSAALTAKVTELVAAAGVPEGHLEFRKSRGGSSDGAAFIQAGVATAYFWSDWDQFYLPGGIEEPYVSGYAGSYPWWHKADTYETMLVSAGDEATLQAGFQTTLDIVSPLLLHMASSAFTPDPEEPEDG
jgi:aminopeptidase S